MESVSYYDVLGLEHDASPAEVKAAYRSAMRKFHPDMGGSDVQASLFQRAYEVLSDPQKRRAYDEQQNPASPADSSAGTPADPDPVWGVDDVWDEEPARADPRPPPPTSATAPGGVPAPSAATDEGVRVVPAFDAGRNAYLIAAATWGVLWLATVVYLAGTGSNGFVVATVTVLAVLALPWHWFDRIPAVRGVAILNAVVVTLVWLTRSDEGPAYLWSGVAVLGGLLVVAGLSLGWSRTARLNRVVDEAAALKHNQWGVPGRPVLDASPVSHGDDAHQYATRCTDRALAPVYAVPGVKVLHGLWWPGLPGTVVDHVVVAGNRVAILESHAVPPGRYGCDDAGVMLRDGEHFLGGQTWAANAAAAWRQAIPGAIVRPFVVAHPLAGGQVRFAPQTGPTALATSAELPAALGQFFNGSAGIVDRRTLAALIVAPA